MRCNLRDGRVRREATPLRQACPCHISLCRSVRGRDAAHAASRDGLAAVRQREIWRGHAGISRRTLRQREMRHGLAELLLAAERLDVAHAERSWHQPPHVDRRRFVLGLALVLAADRAPGDAIEAVARILAGAADQEMLLLVDHVAAVVLAHLEIRRELDRVRGASLLAEPAVDAAREVDAE